MVMKSLIWSKERGGVFVVASQLGIKGSVEAGISKTQKGLVCIGRVSELVSFFLEQPSLVKF